MDPNKLPSVQRYSSWNNMNPLPDIQSRNSNYDQKVQCNYEMVQHNVQVHYLKRDFSSQMHFAAMLHVY